MATADYEETKILIYVHALPHFSKHLIFLYVVLKLERRWHYINIVRRHKSIVP